RHGRARPRGPGPAAFRAPDQRRDVPGARHLGGGRLQPLRPRPGAAQEDPHRPGRWEAGDLAMIDGGSVADPVGQLAEEFVARYRRGERPALSEYTEKYPELADRIRDVFPMLVVMEEADSGSGSSADATGVGPAKVPGREGGPPAQVGGYRILRGVGRGGMGVVYEAEQLALGRHVALKVLPEPIARDPRGLERFRREARAAARLHHTNIVPVHEVGQDGGVVFYAMQFIQGQPLDVVLDELKALRQQPGAPRAAAGTEVPGAVAEVAHSLLT